MSSFKCLIKVQLMTRGSVRMKISSRCTRLFFMVSFSCSLKDSDALCNKTAAVVTLLNSTKLITAFNINVTDENT